MFSKPNTSGRASMNYIFNFSGKWSWRGWDALGAEMEQLRAEEGAGLGRGAEQGLLHPIVSRENRILPGEHPIQRASHSMSIPFNEHPIQ